MNIDVYHSCLACDDFFDRVEKLFCFAFLCLIFFTPADPNRNKLPTHVEQYWMLQFKIFAACSFPLFTLKYTIFTAGVRPMRMSLYTGSYQRRRVGVVVFDDQEKWWAWTKPYRRL